LPSIEKLGQRYNNNDLKILLINLREDKKLVTSFMSKNSYSSTVLLDVDGNVQITWILRLEFFEDALISGHVDKRVNATLCHDQIFRLIG
jgi:hypothetical protein